MCNIKVQLRMLIEGGLRNNQALINSSLCLAALSGCRSEISPATSRNITQTDKTKSWLGLLLGIACLRLQGQCRF